MSVPVDPVSKEDGFEHHDANVKVLLIIGFGIFAALLVAGIGVAGLLWWYDLQPDEAVTALERQAEKPPEPRLERQGLGDPTKTAQKATGVALDFTCCK